MTSRGAFEYTVLSYRTVFGLSFLFGCHQVRCSGRREASGRFEARAPFVGAAVESPTGFDRRDGPPVCGKVGRVGARL